MSLESGITFFIAIFIFGITPGPGVFALISRGLTSGASSCYSLALGMTMSDIIYLLLATLGLATIAENWSGVFITIRFIGAAYLIYLGWKIWTDEADTNLDNEITAQSSSFLTGFIQGFLISASNPKVILFYIAFLPTFMELTVLNPTDIALVAVLTFFALILGLMLVAFSAETAKKQFRSKKSMKILNRSAGSIMMSAGIFLALQR